MTADCLSFVGLKRFETNYGRFTVRKKLTGSDKGAPNLPTQRTFRNLCFSLVAEETSAKLKKVLGDTLLSSVIARI